MSNSKTIKVTQEDLEIPLVNVLTGRGFITGKSGSGKSNTAGKFCEEILEQGYPLLIIDTEGEYYGLKEQYELLHVGADEECDLQVGKEHSQKIAELALEENVPIILDVSGYIETSEVNQLVHDTCKALFDKEKKLKKPFPILVEEAHEWIPEQGRRGEDGEVTQMLIRIGKRGRKRGLGLCALSQRPASVDKDYITQCDYRIWHRLDYETDLKVVKRVLGKKYPDIVKELDTGQAIVEADFLEEDRMQVKFLRKDTFDAGATPDLEDFERPELKSVSSDLVGELEEISEKEQKRQDRITELENEVERLEEEVEEKEDELEAARQNNETVEKLADKLAQVGGNDGGGAEGSKALEEIKEEKNERIRELEQENRQYQERIKELETEVEELEQFREYRDKVERWEDKRDVVREALLRLRDELDIEVNEDVEKYQKRIKQQEDKIEDLEKKLEQGNFQDHDSEFIGSEKYHELLSSISNRGKGTKEGYEAIMEELQVSPATLTQLSNATGYSTSTIKHNYIPNFKQKGWVEKSNGKYQLTEEVKGDAAE